MSMYHILYVHACSGPQSCPTLCNPRDCSLPGSSVHGIFKASIMQWVDISFLSIFSTQGLNTCLLHWQADSLPLSLQGRWRWRRSHSVVSDSLRPHGLYPTRLLRPWDFPGKSAGVDCHFLLQGIFLTQESNPGLPHCRQTLYCLSHQGSLREALLYINYIPPIIS